VKPAARAAAVAAAAGIASAAYQRIAEGTDRRRFPAPGRVVDIGCRRMHILTAGEGSPPVVIVPALASNVLEWIRIQRAASAEAMVCVYDRAGIGWSDPPPFGRLTVDAMADDLHALLEAAGIKRPCIIAGHSMGGVAARRFRDRYPGDVAGMLLVDSSHEDQERRFGWRAGPWSVFKRVVRMRVRILGARRLAANLGLVDGVSGASLARETVPEYAGAARAISLSSRQRSTAVREMLLLARPQGQPRDLGSLPLTVITAASPQRRSWRSWLVWSAMQDELAALSADHVHMSAVNADHNIPLDDPELVAQAIRDLVRRCRQDRARRDSRD
jgi:pimeloyl-ACP methyl ester carboxylesterase